MDISKYILELDSSRSSHRAAIITLLTHPDQTSYSPSEVAGFVLYLAGNENDPAIVKMGVKAVLPYFATAKISPDNLKRIRILAELTEPASINRIKTIDALLRQLHATDPKVIFENHLSDAAAAAHLSIPKGDQQREAEAFWHAIHAVNAAAPIVLQNHTESKEKPTSGTALAEALCHAQSLPPLPSPTGTG